MRPKADPYLADTAARWWKRQVIADGKADDNWALMLDGHPVYAHASLSQTWVSDDLVHWERAA